MDPSLLQKVFFILVGLFQQPVLLVSMAGAQLGLRWNFQNEFLWSTMSHQVAFLGQVILMFTNHK